MFLNLAKRWAGNGLCGMEHLFLIFFHQGVPAATGVMYQGSSGREGIEMREVR
jgi:hypothetical protein